MPEEIRVARFGGTPWEQAIYQTTELTQAHGRAPERVVARHLSASLVDLGIDHTIRFGFGTFDSPTQQAVCGDKCASSLARGRLDVGVGTPVPGDFDDAPTARGKSALCWFKDYVDEGAPYAARDSNLLITNVGGGGCALPRGNAAVGPGGNIDHDTGDVLHSGPDRYHRNLSACLHEIGHNMGSFHQDHMGWGENRDGYWHRTPNTASNDTTNRCGEYIEPRQHADQMAHVYYHRCLRHHIHMVDKAPLDDEPEGCPDGTVPDGEGNCIPIDECPEGYVEEGGVCVPVENGNGNGGIGTGEMVAAGILIGLFFLARPEDPDR